MEAYGIRGRLLLWIADFLLGRSIQVQVNDARSEPVLATSGVPQGSVLGPELFKIYVNDLPAFLQAECLMYADDLKIWARVSSMDEALGLQRSLESLYRWSLDWELPINLAKCSVLPLLATDPLQNYHLGGAQLSVVSVIKDLGTVLSIDLKSREDTSKKVASATRLLAAIRRSFTSMSPLVFRTLFTSHIRPILEFGQPATFPLTKGEAELLERVQRRGTRWVTGLRNLSYDKRLQELNMFSLSYRRRRADLIYTRRILRADHDDLKRFFQLNCDGATRGHPWKLYKPRRRRLRLPLTLSTRVVNDWNNLPAAVVEAPSEACFKRLVDHHLWCSADEGVV